MDEEFGAHPSTTNNVDKSDLSLDLPTLKSDRSKRRDEDDDDD